MNTATMVSMEISTGRLATAEADVPTVDANEAVLTDWSAVCS